ncbi:MAG: phosphoenolpyruvate carboxylase [Chloroflexi bacterium]|nr:phosphoenolpyruvate carboxylase [Chloroflexota bacterium]
MGTQHPDNARFPFFSASAVVEGEAEVDEAFYSYSHLGLDEQMWDFEGKEVDSHVVRKLLTRDEEFFRRHALGEECFLTPRVPNPAFERSDAKVLLETLESIPRSFDVARDFYGRDIAPIFEVILPMTTSAQELSRISRYYRNFIVGKGNQPINEGDITVSQWIGEFKPDSIHVIPLVEDLAHLLTVDSLIEGCLADDDPAYLRVFLARSDPALNYGYVSAVLSVEIALQRLWALEQKTGVPLYPILGVGSVPFRGNFTPENVDNCLASYPSVQTFTIQSAFKYDYPFEVVRQAVDKIEATRRQAPRPVLEERSKEIIGAFTPVYQAHVEKLAGLINKVAEFVPLRRRRKLHIGLFGYSRDVGKVRLPRAIGFCAALYSLGVPPEVIGLESLTKSDLDYLRSDESFTKDLQRALTYCNEDILFRLLPGLKGALDFVKYEPSPEHRRLTSRIYEQATESGHDLSTLITEAAQLRHFLG